jgi:putative transposase
MAKTEMYAIERKISDDDLNRLIKSLERSTRILKKLLFIRYRYDGDSVETAAGRIGITKMMGYLWQKKWNAEGYRGLIPRYARKGPSKMSSDQKAALKEKLMHGQYTTAQVRDMIREEFGVQYTMKQVWVILNSMGMRHAKPYPHDRRRPDNAENILKKT